MSNKLKCENCYHYDVCYSVHESIQDLYDNSDCYVDKFKIEKALEKQIPMKPTISHHKYIDASSNKKGEYTLTHCPYCFYEDKELGYFESLVDRHTKYCRRCGQALDWSEP